MSSSFKMFQCYGVEIEYMIVDRSTLDVRPIADAVLRDDQGEIVSDVERGQIAWSNELLAHVIELKTNGPTESLPGCDLAFQENVGQINQRLNELDCCLMPTGMHPWMDPDAEKKLWEHENRIVYETFDRIFNCSGHGWANLQSMHINLPFDGDKEFAVLHSAIRLILPLLPTLAASSPLVQRERTGLMDNRMEFYRHNSKLIPSIAGRVVPELILSQQQYNADVFQTIYRDTAAYDPEGVLRHEWCNSRGAIARFQRGSIEIRVIDAQECPSMDLAIAELTVEILKFLVDHKNQPIVVDSTATNLDSLAKLFVSGIRTADRTVIDIPGFLPLFDLPDQPITAGEFWKKMFQRFADKLSPSAQAGLEIITSEGPLARRIESLLDKRELSLADAYRKLCDCLAQGQPLSLA